MQAHKNINPLLDLAQDLLSRNWPRVQRLHLMFHVMQDDSY